MASQKGWASVHESARCAFSLQISPAWLKTGPALAWGVAPGAAATRRAAPSWGRSPTWTPSGAAWTTWRPAARTATGSSCAPMRPPGSAALGTRVSTCTGMCARSVGYVSCTPSTPSRGKLTRRYSAQLDMNASEGAGGALGDEILGSSVRIFLPVIPASWAWPARSAPESVRSPLLGGTVQGRRLQRLLEAPAQHRLWRWAAPSAVSRGCGGEHGWAPPSSQGCSARCASTVPGPRSAYPSRWLRAWYVVLHRDAFTCLLSAGVRLVAAAPGRKWCWRSPTPACQPDVLG